MKKILIATVILFLGSLTSYSQTELASNDDGILFITDLPTQSFLSKWKKKNSKKCRKLIHGKIENYTTPSMMIKNEPCLVYLILKSLSMSEEEEKQSWFDIYLLMNEDQVNSLYDILYRENASLRAIEINQKAYDFANQNNYKKAIKTINKAIAMYPSYANLYDSKGEFLLKIGKNDVALDMWEKAIEIDPEFLSKNGSTPLYEGLKSLGLIRE